MKWNLKVVTSVALAFVIAGCGVNNTTDNNRRNVGYNNNYPTNPNPNVNQVNYPTNRTNNVNNVNNVGYRTNRANNYQVADNIANRVSGLKEVKSANVLITDHTAYVAAVLNNDEGKNISTKVENKIADTVRSVDKSIDNVYVSTNPEFVNRVKRYANDVQNGRPVTGFGNQFTELVKRIFPNAR